MSEFIVTTFSPWLVSFFLIPTLVLLLIEIVKTLRKQPLSILLGLLVVVSLGAYVRFAWVPNTNRIYFDEDRYLAPAVTFANEGKTIQVNLSTPTKTLSGGFDNAIRVTSPVINGWILKIFGYSEQHLFFAAKIISILQILLVFVAAYLFTKNRLVAFISAALMAFLPINAYWSTSLNLDLDFVFFGLAGFIAACVYARKANLLSWLFLTSTLMVLLFVRLEAFLFIPVYAATIYCLRKQNKLPLFTKRDIYWLSITLAIISIRALASVSILGKKWCCAAATPLEAFSIDYFFRNFVPNFISFFAERSVPFIVSILAFGTLFRKNYKETLPFSLWIVFFFCIYSFYYAGLFFSTLFSGSFGRFFLSLVPPLIILASISIKDIVMAIGWHTTARRIALGGFCVGVILALLPTLLSYRSLIWFSPYDNFVEKGPRELDKQLDKFVTSTPRGSIIIHADTARILITGRTALYLNSFLTDKESISYVSQQVKKGEHAYLFNTEVCVFTPQKCQLILETFEFSDPVGSYNAGGFTYAPVQLKLKK